MLLTQAPLFKTTGYEQESHGELLWFTGQSSVLPRKSTGRKGLCEEGIQPSLCKHSPCIRKVMFPTWNAYFFVSGYKEKPRWLRWRHLLTRPLHSGEINPPALSHQTRMKLANMFTSLKGPGEIPLCANSMSTEDSFLWRWARTKAFPSTSRVQLRGLQAGTWALQRCCATNIRTAAHSQYFSFSLVLTIGQVRSDLPGEQGITRHVSEEPCDGEIQVSWGRPMWNVQGKGETCCSFIVALRRPALMRPLGWEAFWAVTA